MINGKFILFVLTVFISFSGCKKEELVSSLNVDLSNELIVVIDRDFPGLFNFDEKSFGYSYELLNAYAKSVGVPLRVEYDNSSTKTINEKGAHMMLFVSDHSIKEPYAVELFETSYVVLTSKKHFRKDGFKFSMENLTLDENVKTLVSADFKNSKDYDELLDKKGNSHMFIDHREPLKQAQLLGMGEYDYMICERSEAQLISSLIKNVRKVFDFKSKNQINIVMSDESLPLLYDFNRWFSEYKKGNAYTSLKYLYMQTGYAGSQLFEKDRDPLEGISNYDDVMESIALEYGYDWRLLAAMAYNESRFNPHVISNMGAKGLMQIMPIVAKQFKINQNEIMDIDVNITAAVKLLNKMNKMLKFPRSTSESDRLKILMAGYNAGVGHILDAMRLAKKYGEDPNSWSVISFYLQNKTIDTYANDDVVKSGAFRGSKETIAYVDKVLNRYNKYCDIVI